MTWTSGSTGSRGGRACLSSLYVGENWTGSPPRLLRWRDSEKCADLREPAIDRIAQPALHRFGVRYLDVQRRLEPRHRWLDCWHGVGDAVTGMNWLGYWLHVTNIDAGT